MDRSTNITLAGVLVGVVVGFPGGILFQYFRSAWQGHAAMQKATAAAGRAAWRRTFEFIFLGFLLLTVAAYMLGQANDR
jgi:hypothetical protein